MAGKAAGRSDDPWIEAQRRHRLSQAHVQMARELGMNPRKLGKIDNHKQERWKAPLPEFIEHLYYKRFRKRRPDQFRNGEETAKARPASGKGRRSDHHPSAPPNDPPHHDWIEVPEDPNGDR
jgi:hypothetical protein